MESSSKTEKEQESFQERQTLISIHTQIERHVYQIQSASLKLEPFLNSSISFDQSEIKKICSVSIDAIYKSLLDFTMLLEKSQESQKSLDDSSAQNAKIFANIFREFMELCFQLFSRGAFPTNPLNPYIVSLANLHVFYMKMVINPKVTVNKEKFVTVWTTFMILLSTLKSLIHDIDFACYTSKFDDLFKIAQTIPQDDKSMQILQDIADSLDTLKKQLITLNAKADPSQVLLKNTKNCLVRFNSEVAAIKEVAWNTRNPRANELNQKAQIVSQLMFIIDSSLCAFEVLSLSSRIDCIVRSDSFVIDPRYFSQTGLLYQVVLQSSEFLTNELRALTAAGIKNDSSHQRVTQLVKKFSDTLKSHNYDFDIINDVIKTLSEYQPIIPDQKEKSMIQTIDKCLENYFPPNKQPTNGMIQARNYFNEFKFNKSRPIQSTETACLNYGAYVYFYEYFIRDKDPNDQIAKEIDASSQEFKNILVIQALVAHFHDLSTLYQIAIPEISKRSFIDAKIKDVKHDEELISQMLSLLSSLLVHCKYTPVNEPFIQIIKQYLLCCKTITYNCDRFQLDDALQMMYMCTPQPSVLKKALCIQESVDAAKEITNSIMSSSIADEDDSLIISKENKMNLNSEIFTVMSQTNESTLKQITKFCMIVEEVSNKAKFLAAYEAFYDSCISYISATTKIQGQAMIVMQRYDDSILMPEPEMSAKVISFIAPLLRIISSPQVGFSLNSDMFTTILTAFNSLFVNDDAKFKTFMQKLVTLIPFIDISSSMRKAFYNMSIMGTEICLFKLNNQGKYDQEIDELLTLYKESESDVVTTVLTGVVQDPSKSTKKFLKIASSISPVFADRLEELWTDVSFFFDHLKYVSEIVAAAEKANLEEVTQEKISRFVMQNFMLNFFISFSNVCVSLSEKGIVTDGATMMLNFIRILTRECGNLFFELNSKNMEELKMTFDSITSNFSSTDGSKIFMNRIPPIVTFLITLIDNSDARLTPESSSLIRKMQATIHMMQEEKSEIKIKALAARFKDFAWDLQFLSNDNLKVKEAFDQLFSSLEAVFMFWHIQHLSYIANLFISRYFCNLRIYMPDRNAKSFAQSGANDYEPTEMPPMPQYLQNFQQIKQCLDSIYTETAEDDDQDVKNAIDDLANEVNVAFNETLSNCQFGNKGIHDLVGATKKIMNEVQQITLDLRNEMLKCQNVMRQANARAQEEIAEYLQVDEVFEQSLLLKYAMEDKLKKAEVQLANKKATRVELNRLLEKYQSASTRISTDGRSQEKGELDSAFGAFADPSIIKMTQELNDYMDENRELKKELAALSQNVGESTKTNTVINDVNTLERRKEKLDEEIAALSKKALKEEEQKACKNDEELFGLFDAVRKSLVDNATFTQATSTTIQKLVGKVIDATEAHDKMIKAVVKSESMKKYHDCLE